MPPSLIFGDINTLPPSLLRTTLKKLNITRIDTAARYQNGESEKLLGKNNFPQDFTIDTKILATTDSGGSLAPAAIEKSLLNSLNVLGIESVNILYCHVPDHTTPIADQARAFDAHYRKGRFKELGVSNFSVNMLQDWLDIANREGLVRPTWFQGQYNLLCRSYEEELFPMLKKEGIKFAGFSPLAHGFLLGKYTDKGMGFEGKGPFGKWYDHEEMHEAVRKLKRVSETTRLGMEELSLRWLRFHSGLGNGDVVILGASRAEQVERSVEIMLKGPLEEDVGRELSRLWDGVSEVARAIVEY